MDFIVAILAGFTAVLLVVLDISPAMAGVLLTYSINLSGYFSAFGTSFMNLHEERL
jgi:hypothetical protein